MKKRLICAFATAALLITGCSAPQEPVHFDTKVVDAEAAPSQEDMDAIVPASITAQRPRVLIYHTHATEAYLQTATYTYDAYDLSKTKDDTKNVVALGEELKRLLEERGFEVVHDATHCEPPNITTAYRRSLEVMERYPDMDIYIDLHRDAADLEKNKGDVVMVDGKPCARTFFVVGTGEGTYEGEYDPLPDFEKTYAFAKAVALHMASVEEKLVRPIMVKVGRFNQHVSEHCLLAEVGHNANTMEEAMNAMPHLADGIAAAVKK